MQKKDKEKVFGGEWNNDQLGQFLNVSSYDGDDADYIAAIRAYRHMVPETFGQYVEVFKAQGHDLNAKNRDGVSILATIRQHAKGAPYAELLQAAGAA
ncbi:PA4642 family protein [Oceanobacter mangrovi]|uniref:PA4642 family protein n=1 Tax=Oceanobacter mangrovi TaxID=2862510 RepID=UPI001C8E8D8B|nr:PA4642 family protein [Oceanobacter mangrovi]